MLRQTNILQYTKGNSPGGNKNPDTMQLLLTDRQIETPEETPEGIETFTCADCECESETEFEDFYNADGKGICESCSNDYCTCDRCDDTTVNDDSVTVHAARRSVLTWCQPCADSNAFACADCDEHFSDDLRCGSNTNEDSVCESCYESYFYCEGCNETCNQNEYGDDGRCQSCSPEETDDIPEYHSQARPWKGRTIPKFALGVELECYAGDRASVAEEANDCGMIAEQDGSLDNTHGIEIVGSPMKMEEYGVKDCPWTRFLGVVKVKAWDAGTGYGMHVSLNTEGMPALHVAKFVAFIHLNKSLCEAIAGRSQNNWQVYKNKRVGTANRESDKYEAASVRSSTRVEVRIFRATAKLQSFLKNVQFVDAVRVFAQSASINSLTESAFISWIAGQVNYRELRSFLWTKKLLKAPLNFTVKKGGE